MSSTIRGTGILPAEPTMGGGVLYEGGIVLSQPLSVLIDERPSKADRARAAGQREQHRRDAEAERQKQRLQFTKSEAKDPVSYAAVYGGPALTLAAAHAALQSYGGRVTARDDGSLAFQLPRRLSENAISDHSFRQEVLAAIRVLDAARPVVNHCLRSKRPLPDLQPAAGGGVAGGATRSWLDRASSRQPAWSTTAAASANSGTNAPDSEPPSSKGRSEGSTGSTSRSPASARSAHAGTCIHRRASSN